MEKLQPLIVHRFWVIFGVALLMPFVGYWLTTSRLSDAIRSRITTLDGAFNQIPAGETPNATWKEGLVEINQEQKRSVDHAVAFLWKQQQPLMTWPQIVSKDIAQAKYQGDLTNLTREKYRNVGYREEVLRIWKLADPYMSESETGKLILDPEKIKFFDFTSIAPTSQEVWDAEEDVWITGTLMEALARVNAGATSHGDAHVKEVATLNLVGGTGVPGGASSAASPMSMMGMMELGASQGSNESVYREAAMEGGGGLMNNPVNQMMAKGKAAVDFSPADEFGPETPIEGPDAGPEEDLTLSLDEQFAQYGFGSMSGMGRGASKMRRYVHDSSSLPYKTRGFYMKLIMDHRKVPDLIAELTNSAWPICVYRLHQGDLVFDEIGISSGGLGRRSASSGRRSMSSTRGIPDITSFLNNFGTTGQSSDSITSVFEQAAMESGPLGLGSTAPAFNNSLLMKDFDVEDPNIAEVAISGLITIYKPVETDGSPSPSPGGFTLPAETASPADVVQPAPTQASQGPAPATDAIEPTAVDGADAAVSESPDLVPAGGGATPDNGSSP